MTPYLFIALVIGAGLGSLTARPQHSCTGTTYTLDTLAPGRVEFKTCFDFGYCFADTFTEQELWDTLAENFHARQHAVLGRIDTVVAHKTVDTVNAAVVIQVTESTFVTLERQLKGALTETALVFVEHWQYTTTDSISYRSLSGRKFLGFCDICAGLQDFELYPSRECYYEAKGFVSDGDRLWYQGEFAMPGVSISLPAFLNAIGVEQAAAPSPANTFRAVPNPTAGRFRISGAELKGSARVSVYNMAGQRVRELSFSQGAPTGDVDLSGCPPGLYFAVLKSGGRAFCVPLVVQ